jgi:hypothetical protein
LHGDYALRGSSEKKYHFLYIQSVSGAKLMKRAVKAVLKTHFVRSDIECIFVPEMYLCTETTNPYSR